MAARQETQTDLLAEGALSAWRWRAQAASAALVIGAVMLLASAAQAALTACPAPPPNNQIIVSLNQCCRITKPGDYEVANGGLTVTGGACIKIAASGVTLNGNGQTITGGGTGTGIRLLPTAVGDVVYNFSSISGFKKGILDDAPRSVITKIVNVTDNAGDGIVIRANRVYLTETNSTANGGNGVVVKPLAPASVVSSVYLNSVGAQGNKKSGFWLDSLRTFAAWLCEVSTNGADGVDLINSVNSTYADSFSYGNSGDGVKLIGGHGDIVDDDVIGRTPYPYAPSPNAMGLEVRNSDFDTIDNSTIKYNTGDGMLFINGNGENITDLASDDNAGSGIHLKRTTSSRVHRTDTSDNVDAGIWLDGSRGISVEGGVSYGNGTSGVYIGCSTAQEPDGTTCADLGRPASNGNRVAQDYFSYSSAVKPDVGIGIDKGNHHNQILQNTAKGNTTDAVDENKNCDSNQWMLNTFETTFPAQPSCIQ